MGIDLQIVPYDTEPKYPDDEEHFGDTVLSCRRRRALFAEIQKIEAIEGVNVAEGFSSYLGKSLETADGDPVKYVQAKFLKNFAQHEGVTDNYVNRAIWAYLSHLPDESKLALFWF